MVLASPGQRLVLVTKPVPWSKKGTYWKRPPPWAGKNLAALSPLQARHIARFVEEATKHYGETGKIDGLPVVAYHLRGKGKFGGESAEAKANKERKRKAKHDGVPGLLTFLRAKAGET
jgi:hypothetical protein